MSREVVIIKWCDGTVHANHSGEKTPATVEHTVALDGQAAVQIDLCDGCNELIGELIDVLAYGAPVEKAIKGKINRISNSAPKSFHCPLCDYSARSDSGVKQHLKKIHETTTGELGMGGKEGQDSLLAKTEVKKEWHTS